MQNNPPKLTNLEFEAYQRRISAHMRSNVEMQQEVVKAMATYRLAVESLASASDNISQVVGKLAVSTISAHQTNKEYHLAIGASQTVSENDLRQRNLNLALQQVVKFHTQLAQHEQAVSTSLLAEFDKPIQANLDKYHDIVSNWEKDFDKEIKKLQHGIKSKEAEAMKAGKKDMGKLSSSLHELTMKLGELERLKQERMEQALTTDHHQYLLVAHHLQKILKCELHAMKAIYNQDGIMKRQSTDDNMRSSSVSSVGSSPSIAATSLPTVPEDGDVTPRASDRKSSLHLQINVSDSAATTPARSPISPVVAVRSPASPVPPPRRGSEDEGRKSNWLKTTTASHPSIYTTLHSSPRLTNARFQSDENHAANGNNSQARDLPSVPSNPHRKTLIVPFSADFKELEDLIQANFGKDRKLQQAITQPTDLSASGDLRKSILEKKSQIKNSFWRASSKAFDSRPGSTSDSDDQDDSSEDIDLALVVYDYIGAEMDDLNVIEGDVLRVVAVEGDWLYGLLLSPTSPDSTEYIPAEINGAHQVGWVPRTFTAPLK